MADEVSVETEFQNPIVNYKRGEMGVGGLQHSVCKMMQVTLGFFLRPVNQDSYIGVNCKLKVLLVYNSGSKK